MIETIDAGGNKRAVGAIIGTPHALAIEAADKMFNQGKTLEQAAKEIGEDVKANPKILESEVVLPVPEPPENTPAGAAATLTRQRNKALEQNPDLAKNAPAQQQDGESGEIDHWMKEQYLNAVLTMNNIDPFGKTFAEKDNIFILLRRPAVSFRDWCKAKGYIE